MRILRIITRLNIGGPAIQAVDLTRELIKRDHDCKIIFGKESINEGRISFNVQARTLIQLNDLKREINIIDDYYAFRNIRRYIKTYKPDIVHSHMSKSGFLSRLACLTIPKKDRPKMIHTFHGHVFHSYFGWFKTRLFIWIERFLARYTDAIICISKQQKKEIVGLAIGANKKARVTALGFVLEPFLKLIPSDMRPSLSVGIIGRLVNIKNHELFFEFVEALRNEFYPKKIYAYVIGDGERRGELEVKYSSEFVNFTGWVKHNELPAWYEKLDIVVCSSKNEGTPVSIIEAMASGCLVVSTPVGGCIDLIGKSERGIYLFDPKATADYLKYLILTGEYKGILDEAREYIKENYQLERLVDDIENLYKELLKQ